MKSILICVTGLTPQIVTETLFCLAVKDKIPVDELYIITTQRGRDVILGRDKAPQTPKTPLTNEIDDLCTKYKIKKPKFDNDDTHIIIAKEESLELSDIRTDRHNILFPNRVCEFMRTISYQSDAILYCSISGGRKTMSVHLATALSLFGRENDKLLHVLTSEKDEFKGFYPESEKEGESLELSEIPFVKLRSIISSQIPTSKFAKMKYDEIVAFTQKQLKKTINSKVLQLTTETKEAKFVDNIIRLEPLEFAIYHFFVENRLEGNDKLSIHEITSEKAAQRILEFIKQYYPYYDSKLKTKNPWWKHGFDAEDIRVKISKLNNKICFLINDVDLQEDFIISSYKSYGNTLYGIKGDKNKFRLSLPY